MGSFFQASGLLPGDSTPKSTSVHSTDVIPDVLPPSTWPRRWSSNTSRIAERRKQKLQEKQERERKKGGSEKAQRRQRHSSKKQSDTGVRSVKIRELAEGTIPPNTPTERSEGWYREGYEWFFK